MAKYEVQYEFLTREFEVRDIEADSPAEAETIAKTELMATDPTAEDFEVISVKSIDGN
jgi:hypothetical protein